MSKLIENFNPDDATREQLLSILEELNEKLIPAPAPKPEPVKRGQLSGPLPRIARVNDKASGGRSEGRQVDDARDKKIYPHLPAR